MLRTLVIGLIGLAPLLTGCSGKDGTETYPVSGTVSFNGQPVKVGDIVFEPESSEMSPDGGQIIDGKYNCKAKVGRMKVRISATREIPGKTTKGAMGEDIVEKEEYIPAKYNTATELTAEIDAADENTVNFELK